MRILMLLDHFFPPDIRVENEIKSLIEAGHEVHIACFGEIEKSEIETIQNFTVHRRKISRFCHKSSVGILKFPFYNNFWRRFVADLFKMYSFDVVHVHDLPLARIGLELKNKHNTTFVLDLHENWPVLLLLSKHTNTFLGKLLSTKHQWERYEKRMCEAANKIIVVVDEAKTRISSLGINPKKIFVVSNTLNIVQFDVVKRDYFNKGPIRMLYVGGINYHRGLQYVLDAIKILKDKKIKVHFDLVGDGSYLSFLREKAKILQIGESIIFHGFRKFTEIKDLYREADLALIPHIKSGHTDNTIPHKIFQYMYAEIPIITTNCDPLKRIISETGSGVTYYHDKPEELAEIIENFANNRDLLNNYLGKGRQAVIEKYNWENDSKILKDMYSNILD